MYEFVDDAGYVFSRAEPPAWAMSAAAELLWPDLDVATIRAVAWKLMEEND